MSAVPVFSDYASSGEDVGLEAARWVKRRRPEHDGVLAAPRVMSGRLADALSREAYDAWRRRWWRGDEGRSRRLAHYALAAELQGAPEAGRLGIMPLGAARGVAAKTGTYWSAGEPLHDRWLATLPIFERVERALIAVELIAWYPGEPEKWWRREGAISVLGMARMEAALGEGRPLRVYRTPALWNRAGGGGAPGCCILDWESPEGETCRAFAKALVGDDRVHAQTLQRLIDRRRPRVQYLARKARHDGR